MTDTGLYWGPSQEASESTQPRGQLQNAAEHHLSNSSVAHPKGSLGWHQLPRGDPRSVVSPCTAAPMLWPWPVLPASQPEGRSYPLTYQQQLGLNHNRREHTTHTRDTPGAAGSCPQGHCTTGPHGTPPAIGHPAETKRCNRPTESTEAHAGRQSNWGDEETYPR